MMLSKVGKSDKKEETKQEASFASATPGRTQSTTIGSSIKIKGELSGNEDLVIQGAVEGTVQLKDNNVSIGEQGRIQADVFAKSITVQGELSGDLHASERVTVTSSGKVKGNIVAPRVVLEDGSSFKGSIDMDGKPAMTASVTATTSAQANAKTA